MIELVVVLVIAGILMSFGLRPLNRQREKTNARSARVEASQGLALARSAAMSRGCRAVFHLNVSAAPNSKMWVTACKNTVIGRSNTSALVDTLGRVDTLSKRFGVTVTGTADSVQFDARGLSVGFTSAAYAFAGILNTRDTLTVTSIGKVTQ